MAKTHLLQTVCTVALLAAVPMLAPHAHAGTINPNNQNAVTQTNADGRFQIAQSGTDDPMQSAAPQKPPMHHHKMMGDHKMMGGHGKSDTSQNAEVDRLNDQSYQAAQQGQSFTAGGGATPMPMTAPGGAATDGSAPMGSSPMPTGGSAGSTGAAGAGMGTGGTK